MKRDLAALHDRSDRDGELLAAGVALETTRTMFLAEHPGDTFAERAAVRAFRAVWPDASLKPFAGQIVVLEGRVVEVCGGHCTRSEILARFSQGIAALSR